MFNGCTNFNQPLNDWDVGKVTNMQFMFNGCTNFNQNISNLDVGKVTDMNNMFDGCIIFNNGEAPGLHNNPLNWFNVRNITNLSCMFRNCSSFNQNVSNWMVMDVTNMSEIFSGCVLFNNGDSQFQNTRPLNWIIPTTANTLNMFFNCTSYIQGIENYEFETININLFPSRCFDIVMFDDTNLNEFLNEEEENNFVFVSGVQGNLNALCLPLQYIEGLLREPNSNVFYKCDSTSQSPETIGKEPYVKILISGGSNVLVKLIQIQKLIDSVRNGTNKRYYIEQSLLNGVPETWTYSIGLGNAYYFEPDERNNASAYHCQTGSFFSIYDIKRCV